MSDHLNQMKPNVISVGIDIRTNPPNFNSSICHEVSKALEKTRQDVPDDSGHSEFPKIEPRLSPSSVPPPCETYSREPDKDWFSVANDFCRVEATSSCSSETDTSSEDEKVIAEIASRFSPQQKLSFISGARSVPRRRKRSGAINDSTRRPGLSRSASSTQCQGPLPSTTPAAPGFQQPTGRSQILYQHGLKASDASALRRRTFRRSIAAQRHSCLLRALQNYATACSIAINVNEKLSEPISNTVTTVPPSSSSTLQPSSRRVFLGQFWVDILPLCISGYLDLYSIVHLRQACQRLYYNRKYSIASCAFEKTCTLTEQELINKVLPQLTSFLTPSSLSQLNFSRCCLLTDAFPKSIISFQNGSLCRRLRALFFDFCYALTDKSLETLLLTPLLNLESLSLRCARSRDLTGAPFSSKELLTKERWPRFHQLSCSCTQITLQHLDSVALFLAERAVELSLAPKLGISGSLASNSLIRRLGLESEHRNFIDAIVSRGSLESVEASVIAFEQQWIASIDEPENKNKVLHRLVRNRGSTILMNAPCSVAVVDDGDGHEKAMWLLLGRRRSNTTGSINSVYPTPDPILQKTLLQTDCSSIPSLKPQTLLPQQSNYIEAPIKCDYCCCWKNQLILEPTYMDDIPTPIRSPSGEAYNKQYIPPHSIASLHQTLLPTHDLNTKQFIVPPTTLSPIALPQLLCSSASSSSAPSTIIHHDTNGPSNPPLHMTSDPEGQPSIPSTISPQYETSLLQPVQYYPSESGTSIGNDDVQATSYRQINYSRWSYPLPIAIRLGHLSIVEFLLKKGAYVDVWGYNFATPLYIAVSNSRPIMKDSPISDYTTSTLLIKMDSVYDTHSIYSTSAAPVIDDRSTIREDGSDVDSPISSTLIEESSHLQNLQHPLTQIHHNIDNSSSTVLPNDHINNHTMTETLSLDKNLRHSMSLLDTIHNDLDDVIIEPNIWDNPKDIITQDHSHELSTDLTFCSLIDPYLDGFDNRSSTHKDKQHELTDSIICHCLCHQRQLHNKHHLTDERELNISPNRERLSSAATTSTITSPYPDGLAESLTDGISTLSGCGIHSSKKNSNLAIVELLLNYGAPVDSPDLYSIKCPINAAIKNDNKELLETLIKHGATINVRAIPSHIIPPLIQLSRRQQQKKHPQKGLTRLGYKSPLFVACELNAWRCVSVLLAHGANPHWTDPFSNRNVTPTLLAYRKNDQMLQLFVNKGAGSTRDTRWVLSEVLAAAILQDDLFTIHFLVTKYPDLSERESGGMWSLPLIQASRLNKVSVVQELLSLGANPNGVNSEGLTSLHLAASEGHKAVIECLLRHGAKPNVIGGPQKKTPLHNAVEENRKDVVDALLNFGADITIKNSAGLTPLMAAISARNDKVALVIIQRGTVHQLDAVDSIQRTALMYAIYFGQFKVADGLVEKGVMCRVVDSTGTTLETILKQKIQSLGKATSSASTLNKFLRNIVGVSSSQTSTTMGRGKGGQIVDGIDCFTHHGNVLTTTTPVCMDKAQSANVSDESVRKLNAKRKKLAKQLLNKIRAKAKKDAQTHVIPFTASSAPTSFNPISIPLSLKILEENEGSTTVLKSVTNKVRQSNVVHSLPENLNPKKIGTDTLRDRIIPGDCPMSDSISNTKLQLSTINHSTDESCIIINGTSISSPITLQDKPIEIDNSLNPTINSPPLWGLSSGPEDEEDDDDDEISSVSSDSSCAELSSDSEPTKLYHQAHVISLNNKEIQ